MADPQRIQELETRWERICVNISPIRESDSYEHNLVDNIAAISLIRDMAYSAVERLQRQHPTSEKIHKFCRRIAHQVLPGAQNITKDAQRTIIREFPITQIYNPPTRPTQLLSPKCQLTQNTHHTGSTHSW